jgi:hypothetical protein
LDLPRDADGRCELPPVLTTVVEAFDGDGFKDAPGLKKGIKFWQVENEWDWRWKDTPESFVAFLKIAHETIKAADPGAKVVLGGISKLAPDAFHAGLLGDSYEIDGKIITPASLEKQPGFLEEHRLRTYVLEQGHPYFDVISFHQYGRYRAIEKEVEYLRGIMHKHNYDKPLWMTEVGGPFVPFGEAYTEDRQAQEVVKYYVTALANGVEVLFWSTYLPSPEWGTAFTNTSLLDEHNRKKPAYYSYKLLASKLQGAVRVQRLFSSSSARRVHPKTGERLRRVAGSWPGPRPARRKIGPLLEKLRGRSSRSPATWQGSQVVTFASKRRSSRDRAGLHRNAIGESRHDPVKWPAGLASLGWRPGPGIAYLARWHRFRLASWFRSDWRRPWRSPFLPSPSRTTRSS